MILFLSLVFLFVVGQKRPNYGGHFDSTWHYQLKSGDIRWSGLSDSSGQVYSLYYFMPPLDNWEQIVVKNQVFSFWRANQSCSVWSVDFDVTKEYFDNVTYVQNDDWIGWLNTVQVFGIIESFLVGTDPKTGIINKYVAINAVPSAVGYASEIMTIKERNFTQPAKSLFVVPDFCYKEESSRIATSSSLFGSRSLQ